jgi:hypothetical protein
MCAAVVVSCSARLPASASKRRAASSIAAARRALSGRLDLPAHRELDEPPLGRHADVAAGLGDEHALGSAGCRVALDQGLDRRVDVGGRTGTHEMCERAAEAGVGDERMAERIVEQVARVVLVHCAHRPIILIGYRQEGAGRASGASGRAYAPPARTGGSTAPDRRPGAARGGSRRTVSRSARRERLRAEVLLASGPR